MISARRRLSAASASPVSNRLELNPFGVLRYDSATASIAIRRSLCASCRSAHQDLLEPDMNWAGKIGQWASWTAARLEETEEIPRPRAWGQEVPWFNDFLNLLGEDGPPEDLRETFIAALPLENGLAARYVGLDLYHRLAEQDAYPLQDELVQDARQRAAADYRGLVEAVSPTDVPTDRRRIDWEVRLCGPMRMWDRADRLFEKLRAVDGDASVDSAHAQHMFFRRYAGDLLPDETIGYWIWSTERVTEVESVLSYVIVAKAIALEGSAADDAPPPELVYSEVQSGRWPEVPWLQSVMLARAAFDLGLYREATLHLEAALSDSTYLRTRRDATYEALSTIYERLGDSQLTAAFLQAWSFENPDNPQILMKRAALAADLADYETAYTLLRRAVDVSPDLERDLGTRVGLALGAIAVGQAASWSDLKAAIAKEPRVEQALQKIVSTYWDTFSQLEEAEQTEWIAAVYAAQILAESQKGLATAWLRHAGVAFLAVAEGQLRRRVFAPIREEASSNSVTLQTASHIPDGDRDAVLARYIERGRLTLGQMLRLLERVGRPTGPFAGLISRHLAKSPVLNELAAVRRVATPRNEAVHELSTLDARSIHDDARRIIDSAVAHSRLT